MGGFYQPMPTVRYQVDVQCLSTGAAFYIQHVQGSGDPIGDIYPALETDVTTGTQTLHVPDLGQTQNMPFNYTSYPQALQAACRSTGYIRIMGDEDTVDTETGLFIRHTILILPKNSPPPVLRISTSTEKLFGGDFLFSRNWGLLQASVNRRNSNHKYQHTPGRQDEDLPSKPTLPILPAYCSAWALLAALLWLLAANLANSKQQLETGMIAVLCLPKILLGLTLGTVLYTAGHALILLTYAFQTKLTKSAAAAAGAYKTTAACIVASFVLLLHSALWIYTLFLKDSELARMALPAYAAHNRVPLLMSLLSMWTSWRSPLLGLWTPFLIIEPLTTAVGLLLWPFGMRDSSSGSIGTAGNKYRLSQQDAYEAIPLAACNGSVSRNRYR